MLISAVFHGRGSLHISVTKKAFGGNGRTPIARCFRQKASTLAVSHSTSSATSGGKFLFVHVHVGKSKFACC